MSQKSRRSYWSIIRDSFHVIWHSLPLLASLSARWVQTGANEYSGVVAHHLVTLRQVSSRLSCPALLSEGRGSAKMIP